MKSISDYLNMGYKFLQLSLIIGLFIYSHYQYKKGEEAAENRFKQIQKENAIRKDMAEEIMTSGFRDLTNTLNAKLNTTDTKSIETRTTIIREGETNPRLTDEESGITDGMFNAINKARLETHK